MARSVECASPKHAGLNEVAPTGSATPSSQAATGSSRSSPASSSGAIRAVNPSPAPAVRTLRLSTRPQTPSQLKGLACVLLSPAERRPSYRRAPDSPAISQHSPAVNSLASDARTGAQRSHRRIASEPMLSRAFKVHAVTARERRGDRPNAQQPATPFDFRRATSDALSRSTDALPRSYSSPILHTPKRLLKEPKKKTRTPRRDRAAYASAGGLVKSVLGLAAKTMKGLALSTAQGRRRFRFGHKAGKTRAGPQDAETDWLDEAGWLRAQKQAQKPKHPRHSSTTGARSKRKRVSDESTRSREHRSSASRPPPKTPRSSSSRRSPGSKSTKQASSGGGGGGGGASTFRASSSHKRTRVSYGRLYRSASSSLPHPCPTSEAPSRILSRARPVPRSEAQVGEYSARATLRSSLRSELGRSGYSVHGDLRAIWDKGAEECSEDEEEWVEEPLLVDDFGNVAQYLDSEADLLPFSDPGPMQVPPARPRFYRSLAPSPISTRGLRPFSAGRPASLGSLEAPRPAGLEQDLSPYTDVDAEGSQRDDSDASTLTQFVRELARAQSSSHDGDAEDGSDESEAEAVDSPRETDPEEVTSPRSTTRSQLERWLPFQIDGRGANWLGRESSPSDHETQATDDLRGSAPSLRRSPHIKSPTRRSADSVDLASAQVVGARRLSRELVRKTSLAELRRSGSSAGTVSAPVSPIACSEGSTIVVQSLSSSSSPAAVPAAAGLVPASPQTPGSLSAASGADRTGTTQSAASSRLPSLSPVSPLKVSFRSEGSGGSSPLSSSGAAAAPKVKNSPADAAEQSVRHLARVSAGFSLPAGSTYAVALRQTALSVFRFPERESTGSVRVPAAEGEGQLRRTIRPGTRERGSWEVFRDGVEAREGANEAAGVRGTGKAAGGVEPGVLVERTEASFLRRQVSIATQTGSTRGRTSSTLEDKENAPW